MWPSQATAALVRELRPNCIHQSYMYNLWSRVFGPGRPLHSRECTSSEHQLKQEDEKYRKRIFDPKFCNKKHPQYSHLYLTFRHCCWLSEIRLQSVTNSVLLLNGSAQFWSVSELQSQHFTALPIKWETKTRKSPNIFKISIHFQSHHCQQNCSKLPHIC